jgi:hypothetical protein
MKKVLVKGFHDSETGLESDTWVWLLDQDSINRYDHYGFSYDLNWGLDGSEIDRIEMEADIMQSYYQVYSSWKKESLTTKERLGQFFVNRYYKNPWPELFYESDENKAELMIKDYLLDVQWVEDLPVYDIRRDRSEDH